MVSIPMPLGIAYTGWKTMKKNDGSSSDSIWRRLALALVGAVVALVMLVIAMCKKAKGN